MVCETFLGLVIVNIYSENIEKHERLENCE